MDLVNTIQLTVHPSQMKSALRVLLYAILFHRLLDNVEPETHELEDVHIACAPNASIEKEVYAKIAEFEREVVASGRNRGQLAVVLLQRIPRKGWFAITEDLIPWEEHLIDVELTPRQPRVPVPLKQPLMSLLTFCAAHAGNVPPLTGTADQNTPFSYQILISPPPPSEIFSPSPPLPATAGGVVPRLTSPPPQPTLAISTATARPPTSVSGGTAISGSEGAGGVGVSGASAGGVGGAGTGMGYLEQAKDGLRFVKETAIGWGGRGHGRGGGVSGN